MMVFCFYFRVRAHDFGQKDCSDVDELGSFLKGKFVRIELWGRRVVFRISLPVFQIIVEKKQKKLQQRLNPASSSKSFHHPLFSCLLLMDTPDFLKPRPDYTAKETHGTCELIFGDVGFERTRANRHDYFIIRLEYLLVFQ